MTTNNPKQGEVWIVDLNPTTGCEIDKKRPVVVANDNSIGVLPLRIIVPLTDWKDRYNSKPWFTKIVDSSSNGLSKTSAADGFQVKSISLDRFINYKGVVTAS